MAADLSLSRIFADTFENGSRELADCISGELLGHLSGVPRAAHQGFGHVSRLLEADLGRDARQESKLWRRQRF